MTQTPTPEQLQKHNANIDLWIEETACGGNLAEYLGVCGIEDIQFALRFTANALNPSEAAYMALKNNYRYQNEFIMADAFVQQICKECAE